MNEATVQQVALGIAVVVVTFATIVFGELVPKRIAQSAPERIASLFSPPMMLVAKVTAPAVWLLSHTTDLVLGILRVKSRPEHEGAEEDVRSLMRSGTTGGVFHESEQQIVERVFALSDRTVKSLMVPRPDIDWLPADASVHRIRVAVATSSHSHFPVCTSGLDSLIGVVHVKDLVKSGLISDDIRLAELVRKPMYVPETLPALKLLETFRQRQDRVAFVLDEYGVLEGLVTLNDVVEAIVGDVTGGGDADPEPLVVRRADGSYLLDGMLPVDDLRVLMLGSQSDGYVLPKEEEAAFETLGGFVLAYLGRIPSTGDTFEFSRFRFEVVDMDRHRVDKILLTIREPERATDFGSDAPK
jgi:putative hemolysin